MKILNRNRDKINAWRREDIPEKFHFRRNTRVGDIFALVKGNAKFGKYSWSKADHGHSNDDPGNDCFFSVLRKISEISNFLIKMAVFVKNYDFSPKLRFFTKITIFHQNYDFSPKLKLNSHKMQIRF